MVVHDADGRAAGAGVVDVALGEDDGAVVQHVGVVREEVAVRVDELQLGPRLPEVMGLRDPGVAAGGAVPGEVDVPAVVARGERRLVVPRDVAVGLDRRRPRGAVVGRAHEHHVEAVEVGGVDGAGVRNDLDDGVVLPRSLARAKRSLRRPRLPTVRGDVERDVRHRAVARTRLVGEVGRHQVHERGGGIRRDRGLPIVRDGVGDAFPGPAGRRCRRSGGNPGPHLPPDALLVGFLESLEPLARLFGQLLLHLGAAAPARRLAAGGGSRVGGPHEHPREQQGTDHQRSERRPSNSSSRHRPSLGSGRAPFLSRGEGPLLGAPSLLAGALRSSGASPRRVR